MSRDTSDHTLSSHIAQHANYRQVNCVHIAHVNAANSSLQNWPAVVMKSVLEVSFLFLSSRGHFFSQWEGEVRFDFKWSNEIYITCIQTANVHCDTSKLVLQLAYSKCGYIIWEGVRVTFVLHVNANDMNWVPSWFTFTVVYLFWLFFFFFF